LQLILRRTLFLRWFSDKWKRKYLSGGLNDLALKKLPGYMSGRVLLGHSSFYFEE
jgi:hypothetical protein